MKNFKNIYLVGPSRCGKTSMSTVLQEKYRYTHIIMDAVVETMSEVFPKLGIKHGNLDSEEFRSFLSSYSKNLFKYTKHNVIDLEVLEPNFAKSMINEDESTAIYMGYPSITPEEKMKQIRTYDSEFDWTKNLSDEELIKLLTTHIETSKSLKEKAIKNGFEFIDTSFNREETIVASIEKMINSGKLDRTDKSYERYYR